MNVCAIHISMRADALEHIDESLSRIRVVSQRASYRRRLLDGLPDLRNLSELRLLRVVERRTRRNAPPAIRNVADDLGIEHSTASRGVANAVANGFLVKTSSRDDQRAAVLELTERGREGLEGATARRRAMLAESLASWSDADLESLMRLMSRLADDLDGGAVG